jgi:MFS family permease
MAVGVGEASLTPAAYSMISDYFPPARIARPISVFTGSGFIGSGIALIGGGAVLAALQAYGPIVLPGLGALADWKAAFVIVSLPGLLVALLLWLTVREPPRSEAFTAAPARPGVAKAELLGFLRERATVVIPLFLGLSLLAASQFAIGAWTPSFFIRTFGWTAARIGVAYGLLVSLGGAFGVIAGGWLADRMKARGIVDANLRVPILAALAAAPLAIAFPLVSSPTAAIALLAPLAVLGPMPFGAGTAAIPALAPNRLRAQLVALYLLVANVVGVGAGPWLVAQVTDGVFGDPSRLGYSLAIVAPGLLLLGAGLISLALGAFRRVLQVASDDDLRAAHA